MTRRDGFSADFNFKELPRVPLSQRCERSASFWYPPQFGKETADYLKLHPCPSIEEFNCMDARLFVGIIGVGSHFLSNLWLRVFATFVIASIKISRLAEVWSWRLIYCTTALVLSVSFGAAFMSTVAAAVPMVDTASCLAR